MTINKINEAVIKKAAITKLNLFFGEILAMSEKWDGSQMLFPIKYQEGVQTVAFNGFDQLPTNEIPSFVNMFFYPSFNEMEDVKSSLIYGETPNYAFA